jgi:hypothetical protein
MVVGVTMMHIETGCWARSRRAYCASSPSGSSTM